MIARRTLLPFSIALVLPLLPLASEAQGISEGPITIVVRYTPGTGIDICARVVGEELQQRWKQTVVVEAYLNDVGDDPN